ncbi:MAG: hypothetical protein QMD71_08185 [bacterium]|nr:hypothetical protein [bacterium]
MADKTQIECETRLDSARQVRTYLLNEEYGKAISIYRGVINSQDGNGDPDIHELIGNAYVRMDKLEAAVQEYLYAINLYADRGLFENGVAVCKKIMRISPYNETVYFNLAWLYAKLGLLEEAMNSLITYLKLSKDRKELQKEPQKYRKMMDLFTDDESLKSKLNEVFGFNPDGFAQYVEGYNKVKKLLIEGYSIDEIKEATGFDNELIKKYQEIANNHLIGEV